MNEGDMGLLELVAEFNVAGMTAMTLYLTAVSGYLFVAYMIGNKLTRLQCAIITGLFLWFSVFVVIGTAGYFSRAVQLRGLYNEFTPSGMTMDTWVVWSSSGLELVGLLAALKFMWDVRHPKTE
jgi:hypothetical protein